MTSRATSTPEWTVNFDDMTESAMYREHKLVVAYPEDLHEGYLVVIFFEEDHERRSFSIHPAYTFRDEAREAAVAWVDQQLGEGGAA